MSDLFQNPDEIEHNGETYVRKASLSKQVSVVRFEDFWATHPGAKQNKKGAREKYARAVRSGVSEQTLIDAAAAYAVKCVRMNKPPRLPSTWLNQEGWTDDADIKAQADVEQAEATLKFWADIVNGPDPVFGLSEKIARQLVAAGMVDPVQLREKAK